MKFVEIEPGRLTLREAASDALRPGWTRVRVAACGVCGTDLHLLHGMQLPPGSAYPLRPGHEVAGTVVDPGDAPDAPPAGTPVLLHPLVPCGRCDACRDGAEQRCARARVLGISDAGGLATEVDWPADRLVRADGLDLLTAAVLPDAVATAHHALAVGAPPPGAAIAVLGAGGVGTHFLQLARAKDPTARLAAVVQSAASAQRIAEPASTPTSAWPAPRRRCATTSAAASTWWWTSPARPPPRARACACCATAGRSSSARSSTSRSTSATARRS